MSQDFRAALLCGDHVTWIASCGREVERKEIRPRFPDEYRDRAVAIARRNEWKMQGMARMLGGGTPIDLPETAIGVASQVVDLAAFDVSSGTGGAASFVYVVQAEGVSGLFRVDAESEQEHRLFHSNLVRVQSISPCSPAGRLLCSTADAHGTADLALIDLEHGGITELTEGDSVDEAPAWVEGSDERLVYQSAGVSRGEHGYVNAVGPRSIQRLDLAAGRVEEVLAEDSSDLLCPRQMRDGTLYFLRRPWKLKGGATPWEWLRSIALFPFHLGMAVFHVVHLLSRSQTRKPLLPEARRQQGDGRPLWLWGALVDEASKSERRRGGDASRRSPPSLVPPDWQLVRRTPEGEEQILARGVVSYAPLANGEVLYTTGHHLHRVAVDGANERICSVRRATRLVVLNGA
ncbi:MAG: hypothetical protein DWQ36_01780 [Acidobacteria bacterium]|nr:MAG: hypothetical protein DWQ30_16625 [Acidobacteriota bacterium]REK11501.1 MAG: hypothetical protein DWQ36_01780 [Acidobacteriota bacterium]